MYQLAKFVISVSLFARNTAIRISGIGYRVFYTDRFGIGSVSYHAIATPFYQRDLSIALESKGCLRADATFNLGNIGECSYITIDFKVKNTYLPSTGESDMPVIYF